VGACQTPGKTAVWTAAPSGARCALAAATALAPFPLWEKEAPGLALLSAPMPPDGPAFVTLAKTPLQWDRAIGI
jgi:hypothetical protein